MERGEQTTRSPGGVEPPAWREAALTVTRGVVPLVGLCLKISTCGRLGDKLFGRHAALGRGGLALGWGRVGRCHSWGEWF